MPSSQPARRGKNCREADAGRRTTKMITRNLARRLERLETRLVPAGEPVVIQVHFVSPDGRRTDGPRFTIPGAAAQRRLGNRHYGEGLHR